MDYDCRSIESALASPYGKLFKFQNCVYSSPSSESSWSWDYSSVRDSFRQEEIASINREIETCDSTPNIQMIYSAGGRTSSLLMDDLWDYRFWRDNLNENGQFFPTQTMMGLPSLNTSSSVMEILNVCKSLSRLDDDNCQIIATFSNDALFGMCG